MTEDTKIQIGKKKYDAEYINELIGFVVEMLRYKCNDVIPTEYGAFSSVWDKTYANYPYTKLFAFQMFIPDFVTWCSMLDYDIHDAKNNPRIFRLLVEKFFEDFMYDFITNNWECRPRDEQK